MKKGLTKWIGVGVDIAMYAILVMQMLYIFTGNLLHEIFGMVFFGCLVVLIHSILRERKIDTRSLLMKKPVVIRCLVLFLLLMSLVVIGNKPLSQGGFIYANF